MYIKDRLRRSMMFIPGNNPGMIRDANIYGADSIMFDLEDSVAYTEKDAARLLVYNALKTLDFGSKETVVRINDLSSGLGVADLEAVVRAGVQVVRLPKTDSAQDVIDCEREIERIEKEAGIPVGTTGMMAAIESANGVLNAAAKASDRLIGIALGAEDYVTDLKTTRSDGIELLFARSMILNAARAAGIAALDTVYSDVNNEEGFVAEATINRLHSLFISVSDSEMDLSVECTADLSFLVSSNVTVKQEDGLWLIRTLIGGVNGA